MKDRSDLTGFPKPVRSLALTIITAVVTVGFTIVLALNVAPWLRGPKAWRWPYAIPGTFERLWLPAVLLALYVALAVWLVRRIGREDRGREDLAPTQDSLILGRDNPGRDNPAPTRWVVGVAIVAAMIMTPAIQLALLYMDHTDVRSQLFYRTVSEGANGFFNVGAVVMDRYDFLRYFAERAIDWYPTHAERHPPGLPVLFSLARQALDAAPRLTDRLNDLYRAYQCHNVPLMNLPDGAIASATVQMMLPLVLSLVVPPLYLLGREVYGRPTAIRAVLLWPLLPGIALWAAYWTPLYALFTVLALLLFHYAFSRRSLVFFVLSGLVVSVSTFLSFGNAAIVGFLGAYALFWLASAYGYGPGMLKSRFERKNLSDAPGDPLTPPRFAANDRCRTCRRGATVQWATQGDSHLSSKDFATALGYGSHGSSQTATRAAPDWRWLLQGALLFVLGTASLWLWLWFRFRLSFFAVWQTAMGKHFEMHRTGWFWIFYHLYDFFVAAAGIPILFYWAARTWDALCGLFPRRSASQRCASAPGRAMDVLALSFLLGLAVLDLSGAARGEVARVWAFLLPLPLLIAVYRMPRRGIVFPALIVLLSLQLFVSNVFVRYIGTDLIHPPDPPPQAVVRPDWTPVEATWAGGIALRGVQVPQTVVAGEPVTVGGIWATAQRVHRPYTAFVHLFDDQGRLVAQRDALHLDGGWPTTCWRPGEPFEDHYTLVQLEPLAAGPHRVEIGLYWLPSGERLPVTGPGAQPHQAVNIGTIEVKAK